MKIQDYRLLIKKKLEYKDVYVEELDFEEHERLDKVIDVAFALYDVVGQSEQLFCRDCKYDKAETYHDKMWCRDCRQKDRFKAK
jgi:pentatricopeptide repeat protein